MLLFRRNETVETKDNENVKVEKVSKQDSYVAEIVVFYAFVKLFLSPRNTKNSLCDTKHFHLRFCVPYLTLQLKKISIVK